MSGPLPIKLKAHREWTKARRPKSERRPTKGEVWTCAGHTWECFDDEPTADGRFGWRLASGTKLYTDTGGLTPPRRSNWFAWLLRFQDIEPGHRNAPPEQVESGGTLA